MKGKRDWSDWGKEVRHKLIDLNMTIPELAVQFGISNCYMYDILSGARKATDKRAAINKFLGIDNNGE